MKIACTLLLALAATGVAAVAPAAAPASTPPSGWVDPNRQTEGFQASLTVDGIKTNPLGLTPAVTQREGAELPNGGVTFSSQHNAEVSLDAANLWTWEFDGYNAETFGLTVVVNLKDPKWPTVYKMFESVTSADFAPIEFGELNKTDLDAIAQGMTDGTGKSLGYKTIWDAVNASALGVVSRLGPDQTQGMFGILGNDASASVLVGGIDMPVDDVTSMPLTDEELNALGAPPADVTAIPTPPAAAGAAPTTPATSAPPSAAGRVQAVPAMVLAALAALAAVAMA